jgi:hypothetical protein
MGVGAAYGAEADGTDIWGGVQPIRDSIQILQSAPGTRWALRKASAIAEEARKEAELEREKEALESLIRQQENADFGLRADALLLSKCSVARLHTALAALPQTSISQKSRCQELVSALM